MKKIAASIFFVLIWISCDTGVPPSPPPSGAEIHKSDFSKVNIQLTDYDQVQVTHQLGTDLYSNELIAVSVGLKDSANYSELARAPSTFDTQAGVYRVQFTFTVKMDPSLIATPLTIRYHLGDSSLIDVDTTVALYSYPYPSTQILFTKAEVGTPGFFQDLDRIGDKFFFHPTGPEGLYEYTLSSKQLRHLFLGSGNHIAADSHFVFYEWGALLIRYNLLADSIDLMSYVLSSMSSGLDTRNGYLYLLAGAPPTSFRRYSYDGVYIDSIAFSENVYYLAIDNDIAYMTVSGTPNRLMRYNLQTKTFLSDVMGPAYNLMGIKIYQGVMYYSDFNKRLVGYISVSDLKN